MLWTTSFLIEEEIVHLWQGKNQKYKMSLIKSYNLYIHLLILYTQLYYAVWPRGRIRIRVGNEDRALRFNQQWPDIHKLEKEISTYLRNCDRIFVLTFHMRTVLYCDGKVYFIVVVSRDNRSFIENKLINGDVCMERRSRSRSHIIKDCYICHQIRTTKTCLQKYLHFSHPKSE